MGIKAKDALHVAAAVEGEADYFISTDDALIKKLSDIREISGVNPINLAGVIDEYNN